MMSQRLCNRKCSRRGSATSAKHWRIESETINGQRYRDFTQGNVTLKITDLTPQERGIQASLVRKKVHGKVKLLVHVTFADTGQTKQDFLSPFQTPKYRGIRVSFADRNGDGIPETVVLTAKKGHKTVTLDIPG